jgi:kanamycin kinase
LSIGFQLKQPFLDGKIRLNELARISGAPPPRILSDPPPVDRLVVCHGDACAPNTLIDDDGSCSGHVDLGALGLADRWADLAVATLSLSWNYPGHWEDELLDAYGIDPDAPRIEYYRRLWQAGDMIVD